MAVGHQLGDAEVEQANLAVRRDEDVGWLQITVDDERLVRVLHRRQHLQSEIDARVKAEPIRIAIDVKGDALDVLERDIRLAVLGDARIEQARDVRVVELGEDGAFAHEALAHRGVHEARV